MQNEKGMFDNYSNLQAKSLFMLHKDHLKTQMLSGQLVRLGFHRETKEIKAVMIIFL